jgi:hypothetical protein
MQVRRPRKSFSTSSELCESILASEESAFECFFSLLFGDRAGSLLELETERVERFVMVESEAAKTEIGDRHLRIAVAFVLKKLS